MDKLLTIAEAAQLLQVSRETVARYLRNGTLKGVRLSGKYWRIDERDLEAFVEAHKQSGQ